ncbi:hypothetical protein ACD661_09050 [Legionella lytica]|uniref:Uncharacterized protein n=1 Tax=Legionella lytica TaxID=96232 RepID=A0ABW8D7K8_9GAMM
MCEESKNCLCHKIKECIIKDKKGIFLSFFTVRKMNELYLFLKDSYPLTDPKFNDKKFDEHLHTLVRTYIKPNKGDDPGLVINVNREEIKKKFRSTYRKYQNQERDKTQVLERLMHLIHDIEKLTYNNLEDNPEFMAQLQKGAKLRRSSSLRLPRFLVHKKSPANEAQTHEGQAESSSSSAPTP